MEQKLSLKSYTPPTRERRKIVIEKGFIATCEWCGNRELFVFTKTKKEVEYLLKIWGWVKFEKRDFCCESCKIEFIEKEESC